jgi:phosphoribosyl 1,2-cyclic phosphodiesterase
VKVRFWGVRGSIPTPGPETNRYGGNTPCVSVESDGGHVFVIDMGTGALALGNHLMAGGFDGGRGVATVLLSHAHWDHIQGFGFFAPAFVPGNRFEIFGNASSSQALEGILEGQMNPHFSPIYTLRNLGAQLAFTSVVPGETLAVADVALTAVANPHGSTTALAFRLESGGRSIVYASDVGYLASRPSPEALALYRGADLLIHDSTYTPEDQASRRSRGYSSWADAAGAALAAGVKHLALMHYDQDYGDDVVDAMRDACRQELDRQGGQGIRLTAAAEGLELDV